jgi:DNA-binding Lrp family transcriptional regulator
MNAIRPGRPAATPGGAAARIPSRTTPGPTPAPDAIDVAILQRLSVDARTPNNALAEQVGVAASTCLGRVRSLRERGVIRGFHADVDPAAVGRPIQAMISVRMQAHARGHMTAFASGVSELPGVLNVFFLAGADDFLIHIAARSTEDLRDFVVVNLSGNSDVALTQTSLIFEHIRAVRGAF